MCWHNIHRETPRRPLNDSYRKICLNRYASLYNSSTSPLFQSPKGVKDSCHDMKGHAMWLRSTFCNHLISGSVPLHSNVIYYSPEPTSASWMNFIDEWLFLSHSYSTHLGPCPTDIFLPAAFPLLFFTTLISNHVVLFLRTSIKHSSFSSTISSFMKALLILPSSFFPQILIHPYIKAKQSSIFSIARHQLVPGIKITSPPSKLLLLPLLLSEKSLSFSVFPLLFSCPFLSCKVTWPPYLAAAMNKRHQVC